MRIVELDGSWSCPVGGAGAVRARLDDAGRSKLSAYLVGGGAGRSE